MEEIKFTQEQLENVIVNIKQREDEVKKISEILESVYLKYAIKKHQNWIRRLFKINPPSSEKLINECREYKFLKNWLGTFDRILLSYRSQVIKDKTFNIRSPMLDEGIYELIINSNANVIKCLNFVIERIELNRTYMDTDLMIRLLESVCFEMQFGFGLKIIPENIG